MEFSAVPQDLEKLKEWTGRREIEVDYVTIPSVYHVADNKTAKLWVIDQDGALALSAEAEFK